MVLWITGLSASGKTTISKAFLETAKQFGTSAVLLDGDAIRELFGGDLSYDLNSRIKHIRRVQRLAKFLNDQGINVVVAALYSNQEILLDNRNLFNKYFEVYLKAEVEILKSRENNMLYTKAQNGEIRDVVGVDIEWHEPRNPDLVFDTNLLRSPNEIADKIYSALKVKLAI